MERKLTTLIMGLATLALVGCSHSMMRGSVAMKTGENEAHVCLGSSEAKVGQRVTAYRNDCPTKGSPKSGDGSGRCQKVRLGEGSVMELLNEHYSLVRFDSGVSFNEGNFVEVNKH